jgi:putative ubiquitin-RnfH superfamily antitoxin RatB of RatAB toxin-antitoxin module
MTPGVAGHDKSYGHTRAGARSLKRKRSHFVIFTEQNMTAGQLLITVAYSPAARQVEQVELRLPEGSTVRQAVQASGLCERYPALDLGRAGVGVWGRPAPPDQPLRDRDRVELYRPLTVDPKVARRQRFGRQGARAAGLFARRRPGAKPGY